MAGGVRVGGVILGARAGVSSATWIAPVGKDPPGLLLVYGAWMMACRRMRHHR
jgi:hypothetical protein